MNSYYVLSTSVNLSKPRRKVTICQVYPVGKVIPLEPRFKLSAQSKAFYSIILSVSVYVL